MKMEQIFLHVFNMSISAGWLVFAVMLLRLLLKKAPKWVNCVLWGVVVLRLIMPFSIESVLSLIPSAETLPPNITVADTPMINSGLPPVNMVINPVISETFKPMPGNIANPMQTVMLVAATVWLAGIGLMIVYGAVSYLRVRYKVRVSLSAGQGVYYCDGIDTPFILGVFRPRIYLPSGIDASCAEYVLRHERAHLKRRDHLWKPLGFALLTVYWFNPLLWVAYILFCRDIEKACDEKVIRDMSDGDKKGYSSALLDCSVHQRRLIMACPLAFGEVGVKSRIKSVLNYKKPAFWIIIVAMVAVTVTCICFLTNPPKDDKGDDPFAEIGGRSLAELKADVPQLFGLDTSNGFNMYVWQYDGRVLCNLLSRNEKRSLERMWSGQFVSADEMELILDNYGVSGDQIMVHNASNLEREAIKSMFDMDFRGIYTMGFYDDMSVFDIDNDGEKELCVIVTEKEVIPHSDPYSSSAFVLQYVRLVVTDTEKSEIQKYTLIDGAFWISYSPHFIEHNGKTYLQCVDYSGEDSGLKIQWTSGLINSESTDGESFPKFSETRKFENSVFWPVSPVMYDGYTKVILTHKNSESLTVTSSLYDMKSHIHSSYGFMTNKTSNADDAEFTVDFYDANGVLKETYYVFDNGMISSNEYTENGVCKLVESPNAYGLMEYLEGRMYGVELKHGTVDISSMDVKKWESSETLHISDEQTLRKIWTYIDNSDTYSVSEETAKGYGAPVFSIFVHTDVGSTHTYKLWSESLYTVSLKTDPYGNEYFLSDADLSALYRYLETLFEMD